MSNRFLMGAGHNRLEVYQNYSIFFCYWNFKRAFLENAEVRIAEGDNTAQSWPNLGSHQSAIVIGPVSPFASVKCWADDGGLFRLFKLTDLQPKLGPVSALYQADFHFYYGIQFRKQKSQSPDHGRHITGPCVTFTTANHSGSEKTRVRHSIGPFLCRKQVLAAKVWARIGRQLHTGVIIPAVGRYWQPIFGNIFADSGPVLGRFQFRICHFNNFKPIVTNHVLNNSKLCNAESSFAIYSALSCMRYFMQLKDVFRDIPGVFGITWANWGIFGVEIFTVLGR